MNKVISGQLFQSFVSTGKYYLVLFILWPFLAFLLALTNYSQKEARKVVYIFLIYYGLTFVIGNIGADAERYAFMLNANARLPFSDFFKIVGGIYTSDTSVDIIEPLISFVVSRFTTYHGVLFAVYAGLFGFFYLKSINLLHDRYLENPGWSSMIIMAFFVLILPFTAINGVRMWTAAWIFFYGAYHVVLYRDARFLIIALGASLMHFSFLSANILLLIYFFAGNRNFIYLPLAVSSFVLPQLIAPVIQSVSLNLGGGLQNRFEMYTNEYVVIESQKSIEQVTWFLKISNELVFYYLLLAIIVIQLKDGSLMKEKYERNLFSFLLLLLSFVNFGKNIPSFGERYRILFFLFATVYIFLYIMKHSPYKINLLIWVGLFPMALYAAVAFRQGFESISAWILTPLLGLPLVIPDLSVADLLFH